jgi:hypothetical protein
MVSVPIRFMGTLGGPPKRPARVFESRRSQIVSEKPASKHTNPTITLQARQLKQTGNERFITDRRLGKDYASYEVWSTALAQ